MPTSRRLATGLTVAIAAVLSTCAPPIAPSPLSFPPEAAVYPGRSALYRPQGTGPFPAVVLLPTCGGVAGHLNDWAGRLTNAGYVALVVDSLWPRKVTNNCQGAAAIVTLDEIAADAAAALAHLRTLPEVASDRLAIMGFSWGSMAALRLAGANYQKRITGGVEGLRAVAFFYGTCGTDSPLSHVQASSNNLADDIVTPTILFLGAIDTESPPRFCTSKVDWLRARGQPITYKVYPDTTHSFDSPQWGIEGRMINHGARGTFLYRYNPEATSDAWREVQAFFAEHLKPAL